MSLTSQARAARDVLSRSLIREQEAQSNFCVRCLQTIDIFSFIPVPKSGTVSTKCSLIGSLIFFLLFLGYITYDLVQFITNNKPLPNSFNEDLSNVNYTSPRFAFTFMTGEFLEIPLESPPYYKYLLEQSTKFRGGQKKTEVTFNTCKPEWLDDATKDYYTRLYCPDPSLNLTVGGLLYSSEVTTNPKLTISECINGTDVVCTSQDELQSMLSKGRFFLFIEKPKGTYDTTDKNNFLLYNVFGVHGTYNRLSIQLQVNKEIVMPDYLRRFSEEETTRLQILSVYELNSFVANLSAKSASYLLSVEFTLAPVIYCLTKSVKVTKIAYSTLIDHVAQWGALWGVEFTIFAVFFLAYNRKKFYEKNPRWSRFEEEPETIQTDSVRRPNGRE